MFANGKVDVIELKVKEDSLFLGLKINKIKEKLKEDIIIAAILRDEKLLIPRGDAEIKLDDELYIIAKNNEMYKLLKTLKLIEKPIKSVFVVGSGKIGKYLFKNLSQMKLKTKVVENNKEKCIDTAEQFPEITVVHGNGVDAELLIEEGIKDYDCCVAITGEDEINIVVTLFAWSHKIRKLITKVISVNYSKMLNNVDRRPRASPFPCRSPMWPVWLPKSKSAKRNNKTAPLTFPVRGAFLLQKGHPDGWPFLGCLVVRLDAPGVQHRGLRIRSIGFTQCLNDLNRDVHGDAAVALFRGADARVDRACHTGGNRQLVVKKSVAVRKPVFSRCDGKGIGCHRKDRSVVGPVGHHRRADINRVAGIAHIHTGSAVTGDHLRCGRCRCREGVDHITFRRFGQIGRNADRRHSHRQQHQQQ